MIDNHKLKKTIGANPRLVQPFGNYIVVEILKAEDTSIGGVLLPEQVRDKDIQSLARVIAVGQGQRSIITGEYIPCLSKPGDLLIILKHTPVEIKLGGHTFHVIFEGDVIGRVDEKELGTLMEEGEGGEEFCGGDVEEYSAGTISQTPSGIFVAVGREAIEEVIGA